MEARVPAKLFSGLAVVGMTLALAGCSEYLDRRDTIAYSAGNATASNRIIHTIDPYPSNSFRRGQSFDGVKAEQASRNYHAPRAPVASVGSDSTTNAAGAATQ